MNFVEWIIFFVVTLLVSFSIHQFLLKASVKYTLKKANVGGIRFSAQTKPVSGGITFYFMFLLTVIAYFFISKDTIHDNQFILPFLIVITISFLMGLADDIVNSSPFFKLFVQLLSGLILVNFGLTIDLFEVTYLNNILTIFWVIGIMNSINMIDNMDGISGLITTSILFGIVALTLINGVENIFITMVVVATLASVLSYLYFNIYPAKMYMGDNGSQFLGSLLAILGIIYFWNAKSVEGAGIFRNAVVLLLAFLVPITDTTTVTINRIMRGQSPFVGGKDHTTHHLFYMGLSVRKVGLALFSIALISVAISVFAISFIKQWNHIYYLYIAIYIVAVFGFLYSTTKIFKPRDEKKSE